MRASKRDLLLEAAVRIVEEQGITAVTLDSVATAAGLTKGGLMYHFPTREALLTGLHTHLAAQWEAQLEAELKARSGRGSTETDAGADADTSSVTDASPADRLAAYARVSTRSATRAELALQLEAAGTPHAAAWQDVLDRWTTPLDEALAGGPAEQVIARLAADGLWIYEALAGHPLDAATRDAVADRIAAMIAEAPGT